VQFVVGQLNVYGRELGQSTWRQLEFATAIFEYARGLSARLETIDLFEISQ